MRPTSAHTNRAPTANPAKKQAIETRRRGLTLISGISLTFLEVLHFGIASRCWNWTLNRKWLAERKEWKNWSVVSLAVGCAAFTLTNAGCHPSEQGMLKWNKSEEEGEKSLGDGYSNLVGHCCLPSFPLLISSESASVCNLYERSALFSAVPVNL